MEVSVVAMTPFRRAFSTNALASDRRLFSVIVVSSSAWHRAAMNARHSVSISPSSEMESTNSELRRQSVEVHLACGPTSQREAGPKLANHRRRRQWRGFSAASLTTNGGLRRRGGSVHR